RACVNQMEAAQACDVANDIPADYDPTFDLMFRDIINSKPTCDDIIIREVASVSVAGKTFQLPKTLSRYTDLVGDWKSYGGKVFSAQIDFGEDARVNLMYISEDVRIPQHTHK
ncbi:ChrR family anti-sigma-E factor, partial [Vibrio astriarenae]